VCVGGGGKVARTIRRDWDWGLVEFSGFEDLLNCLDDVLNN
jgi:hypothetical protein